LRKVAMSVVRDSRKFSGHPYVGRIARSSLRQLSFLVFNTCWCCSSFDVVSSYRERAESPRSSWQACVDTVLVVTQCWYVCVPSCHVNQWDRAADAADAAAGGALKAATLATRCCVASCCCACRPHHDDDDDDDDDDVRRAHIIVMSCRLMVAETVGCSC